MYASAASPAQAAARCRCSSPQSRAPPRRVSVPRASTVVVSSRRDLYASMQVLRDLLISMIAVPFARTTSRRTAVDSPRVAVATRWPRATADVSMSAAHAALAADATARHGRPSNLVALNSNCWRRLLR